MELGIGILFVVGVIWWTLRTQAQSDQHSERREGERRRKRAQEPVKLSRKLPPMGRVEIMASARSAMLEDMKARANNLATYNQRASPAFTHHQVARADELEEEYAPADADYLALERKHMAEIMDWWNSTDETTKRSMLTQTPPVSLALDRRRKMARKKNDCSFFEECSQNTNRAGCTAETLEKGFAEILLKFQDCERLPVGMSDDYHVVRLFEKGPSAAGLGAFHRQEWSNVVTTEIEPVLDDSRKSWVEHHEFWDGENALRVALENAGVDYGEFLSEIRAYLEGDEFVAAVRLVYDNARRKNRRPSSDDN